MRHAWHGPKVYRWWETCDVDIWGLFVLILLARPLHNISALTAVDHYVFDWVVLPLQDQRTKRPGEGNSCFFVSFKMTPRWYTIVIFSKVRIARKIKNPKNAEIYASRDWSALPRILSCGFVQRFARWFGWPFRSSRGEGRSEGQLEHSFKLHLKSPQGMALWLVYIVEPWRYTCLLQLAEKCKQHTYAHI